MTGTEIFRHKLNEAAVLTSRFISADTYPDSIEPDFLRDAVRYYPELGGKRLRPAITLWCCELCGGDAQKAIAPAAAVEIWHNWTLVHDDLIDNDDFRRGNDATHRYLEKRGNINAGGGKAMALLAGDLQQGWAVDLIRRSSLAPELKLEMTALLEKRGNTELVSGEALDVEFALRSPELPEAEKIERMYRLKTGALLSLAAEFGAMAARGGYDSSAAMLGECFSTAGVAFQLQDDILGLFGDDAQFGKMIGSDLKESKPTVLFAESCRLAGVAARQRLRSLCGLPEYDKNIIAEAREIVSGCGALCAVEKRAAELTSQAMEILLRFPAGESRSLLEELLNYLTGRNK